MGKLKTLLWKNFRWCYRHPVKTTLFFAFPLMLSGFLLMISRLLKVELMPDCDYHTIALPPSNPVLFVQSLVCSQQSSCANKTAGFVPVEKLVEHLLESDHPENDTNSKLCPELTDDQAKGALGKAMMACMTEIPEMLNYRNIPAINMVYRGHILYYPPSEAATNITRTMQQYLDQISSLTLGAMFRNSSNDSSLIKGLFELGMATACYKPLENRTLSFETKDEAIQYARNDLNFTTGDSVWAIVNFRKVGKEFDYTIIPHFDRRQKYDTLVLQSLIEFAVIEYQTGKKIKHNVAEKLLPIRCHKKDNLYAPIMSVMQLLLTMGVVVVVHSVASEISFEKGSGLLEFLFIAGVSRFQVKFSWFLFGMAFLPTVCIMIGALFKYIDPLIIEYTSFGFLIVFFGLYGCSLLCLSFFVASVMTSAQKAGITIIVLLVMAWLPLNWAQILPNVGYTDNINFVRVVSLLHSSIAAQIGVGYIVEWEKNEIGVTMENIAVSPIQDDKYGGVFEAMMHLLLQCPLYLILSWYFDYTAPSKYGIKSPWYFPFTISFWTGSAGSGAASDTEDGGQKADIEETTEEKSAGISIRNLTKTYGGVFKAVDSLNLTLYKHEVTAFLGHNGAGKSTTMNMLTGMIMPTTGTAIVDDRDIRTQMPEVRKNLGFCPQYDIVYPELSVQDHIRFYGELKGIPEEDYIEFSTMLFKQMKMEHALKTAAMNLSGGMKRKLSIAISFLGKPTTVILDEPTSAIDPFSRRAIWDVVLSYKEKTTCLISTHYMQEADILGDRIAIINHGKLKCFGTTMYLKGKYGSGFFLKLAHQEEIKAKEIETKLQEHVPVSLVNSTKTETTMKIPLSSARSENMIGAFTYLENDGKALGVVSFGIAESTMEQVFFRVAADDSGEAHHSDEIKKYEEESLLPKITYQNHDGITLLCTQFWAVFVKRFHLTKRSKIGMVFQILMPLVFTMVLLFLNNVMASSGRDGGREHMHIWNTTSNESLMFYSGPRDHPLIESWLNYGLGTRCMYSAAVPDKPCENLLTKPTFPEDTYDTNTSAACACKSCPDDAIAVAKKIRLQTSNDFLLNLNNRNITNYLLKANNVEFTGGFQIKDVKNVSWKQISLAGNRFHGTILKCMFEPIVLTPQQLMNGESECFDMSQIIAMFLGGGRGGDQNGGKRPSGANGNNSTNDGGNGSAWRPVSGGGGNRNGGWPPPTTASNADTAPRVRRQSGFGGGGAAGGGGAGRGMMMMVGKYVSLLMSVPQKMHVIWTGIIPKRDSRRETKRHKDLRHMTASYLNAYSNVLLRSMLNRSEEPLDYGIAFYTEEISMTNTDLSFVSIISGIMLGMFSSIALIMPTFTPLLVLTTEQASGTKQLQFLMGMNRIIYWIANFIWDITIYAGSVGLVLLFMINFPDVFEQDMEVYFYICMCFGIGMILTSYVLSLLLEHGHIAVLLLFIFTPFFTMAAMVMFMFRDESWHETVDMMLSGLPPYFISISLTLMAILDMLPDQDPVLSWDVLGKRFFCLGAWCLLMVAVLCGVESGLVGALLNTTPMQSLLGCRCFKSGKVNAQDDTETDMDPDVAKEEELVNNVAKRDSNVVMAVKKLVKMYRGGKLAVKGVSFGVNKNECFGLLGVNGAGKSTLFKMLTGFHKPTRGDARINGYSIFKSRDRVARYMSYCPQEDVLFETLTPGEHLNYYGRIRGIPGQERDELCQVLAGEVGLDAHAAKLSSELSGGNKRKLNFAIALLDFPDCIFLDEMTTGMDPGARRSAWNCLRKAMNAGCATVITSHSMEECEALCNRLVIMVNGGFNCIGGVQYLKDKYGKNYNAKFRLAPNGNKEHLLERLVSNFSGTSLVEEHLGYIEVQIPAASLRLSALFTFIHQIKQEYMIEDFAVSQTTLEHVFVNMVKDQE